MSDVSFVDENLATWLEPATTVLTAEQLQAYRSYVKSIASQTAAGHSFDLVRAAHRVVSLETRLWIASCIGGGDAGFDAEKTDELMARLAAAAAAEVMLGGTREQRALVALLVQSGEFLDLGPAIAGLRDIARESVDDASRSIRDRGTSLTSTIASVQKILANAEPKADGAARTQEDNTADAVDAMAKAIDAVAARYERRADLLDEEYNILWWSYTGLSSRLGVPWTEVDPPARRAAQAAYEVRELLTQIPSPPSTRSLLSAALSDAATVSVSLGDFAETIVSSDIALVADRDELLLPVSSCVSNIRKLHADNEGTWRKVVIAVLGLDPDRPTSAIAAAQQLLREYGITSLS